MINVCVTMVTGDQAMDHMILGGVQFTHTIVYGFHRSILHAPCMLVLSMDMDKVSLFL